MDGKRKNEIFKNPKSDQIDKDSFVYKINNQNLNSEVAHSIDNKNKFNLNQKNYRNINKIIKNDKKSLDNSNHNLKYQVSLEKNNFDISLVNKKGQAPEQLEFNMYEKLNFLICKCFKKYRETQKKFLLMDLGKKKINDNLEISKIIGFLEEYKIIKNFFLEEEQLMKFKEYMKCYQSLSFKEILKQKNLEQFSLKK